MCSAHFLHLSSHPYDKLTKMRAMISEPYTNWHRRGRAQSCKAPHPKNNWNWLQMKYLDTTDFIWFFYISLSLWSKTLAIFRLRTMTFYEVWDDPSLPISIAHLDMFTKQQNCQLFGQIKISQDIVHKPPEIRCDLQYWEKTEKGWKIKICYVLVLLF